jgi:hypothetical protein
LSPVHAAFGADPRFLVLHPSRLKSVLPKDPTSGELHSGRMGAQSLTKELLSDPSAIKFIPQLRQEHSLSLDEFRIGATLVTVFQA